MAIFAIGDPHLSKAQPKPMDIFGAHWLGHTDRFFANWRDTVAPDDTVLVPGDISWAMALEDALLDLQDIDALPGRKILIQGNHDYWWQSISRLRKLPVPSIHFLQNDHAESEGWAICGTRGWILPGDRQWPADPDHNAKILAREVGRLALSLDSARKAGAQRILVMMHYPPLDTLGQPSVFTTALAAVPEVAMCLYGHLHGPEAAARAPQGTLHGIEFRLVAGDALGFMPRRLC